MPSVELILNDKASYNTGNIVYYMLLKINSALSPHHLLMILNDKTWYNTKIESPLHIQMILVTKSELHIIYRL